MIEKLEFAFIKENGKTLTNIFFLETRNFEMKCNMEIDC